MEAVVIARRVHVVVLPPITHDDGCITRGVTMQDLLDLGGGESLIFS